jgi:hypothetical protein
MSDYTGSLNAARRDRGLVPDYNNMDPGNFPLYLVHDRTAFIVTETDSPGVLWMEFDLPGVVGMTNMDQGEFLYNLLERSGVMLRQYQCGDIRSHYQVRGTPDQLRRVQRFTVSLEPESIPILLRGKPQEGAVTTG